MDKTYCSARQKLKKKVIYIAKEPTVHINLGTNGEAR